MARTDNLKNYLTDVASAIKEKKGDDTPILASNFDEEIRNLPTGGGGGDQFKARDYILNGKQVIEDKPDFSTIATEESTDKLYKDTDNDGDTYYYRGAVTDNYFKFADKFWRIIRLNGNGSIRLIYDGSKAYANGDTSGASDRVIGESNYNSQSNDNKYVGFKYEQDNAHGFVEPSTILGTDVSSTENTLNKWYEDNILNTNFEKYIDIDTGFICDRTNSINNNTSYEEMQDDGGTGNTVTYYSAYAKLLKAKKPIFTYKNENDYFTSKNVKKGNKSLIYSIGLITADEVSFAGGKYGSANSEYWLYTNQNYWTMSPYSFNGSFASVFYVISDGGLSSNNVHYSSGVRPVLNITGSVTLTGKGTMDEPYEIGQEPELVDINEYISSTSESTNTDRHNINNQITTRMKKLPELDFSNVTSSDVLYNAFYTFENLEEIPVIKISENIKSINLQGTLGECKKIKNVDNLMNAIGSRKIESLVGTFKETGITDFSFLENLNTTDTKNINNALSGNNMETIPLFDTQNVTDISYFFALCKNLITIPALNLAKCKDFTYFLNGTSKLQSIPKLNLSSATSVMGILNGEHNELTELGGFESLGFSYNSKTQNYSSYRLDLSTCPNLTEESLINVIDNLYDLNLTYEGDAVTQQLVLGETNMAKLTPEKIAEAVAKGWTVS